ncbi:MAG: hypothetical protein JSV49_01250 [Thermoplasmata archaeon]|nr:MAG: hypothetical protein JSV49_01250 [Thermoplasmata archaeon]
MNKNAIFILLIIITLSIILSSTITTAQDPDSDENGANGDQTPQQTSPDDEDWWKDWEPIVTFLTIIGAFVGGPLLTYYLIRRTRGKLRIYLKKVDDTYNFYRVDSKMCENELRKIKTYVKTEFFAGKFDENHYLILDKKVDEYIDIIKAERLAGLTHPRPMAVPAPQPLTQRIYTSLNPFSHKPPKAEHVPLEPPDWPPPDQIDTDSPESLPASKPQPKLTVDMSKYLDQKPSKKKKPKKLPDRTRRRDEDEAVDWEEEDKDKEKDKGKDDWTPIVDGLDIKIK